jgi:hypothetical protein
MSALSSWIPPAEGLLPKWLLFVRPALPPSHMHSTHSLTPHPPLTHPGLPRLDPKLDPSLQHPGVHIARLQPHAHGPARAQTRPRNLALEPHVRHLDVPDERDTVLRRVPHHRARVLPARAVDVWGGVCALCQRVVRVWDYAVGEAACGAGVGEHGESGLDGCAVGVVCAGVRKG